MFLSKNYFIKLFKKHVGKTPHQYIKDYRFGMAIAMIENGKSVTDTAIECGYQSASAFSLAFKNKLGVSPQTYVKNPKIDNKKHLQIECLAKVKLKIQ